MVANDGTQASMRPAAGMKPADMPVPLYAAAMYARVTANDTGLQALTALLVTECYGAVASSHDSDDMP